MTPISTLQAYSVKGSQREPGGPLYEQTKIDESKGERWFCSEAEAHGWLTYTDRFILRPHQ